MTKDLFIRTFRKVSKTYETVRFETYLRECKKWNDFEVYDPRNYSYFNN